MIRRNDLSTRMIPVLPLGFLMVLVLAVGCETGTGKKKNATDRKQAATGSSKEKEMRQQAIAEAELDKEKQKFIFDAEHITFEIEQLFGKEWKKAFSAGDESRLSSFLFPAFTGKSIESMDWQSRSASVVTEKYRRLNSLEEGEREGSISEMDASQLVNYLNSVAANFESIDRVKFRVLAIEQPIPQQPVWKCKILIDAVGSDSEKKPQQYESEQAVVFELANLAEITTHPVISEWKIHKEVWRNADRLLTKEVTDETLISEVQLANNWDLNVKDTEQYWFQYAAEDYDRDGDLDFAVACNMFYPRLFTNSNGRFIETAGEKNVIAVEGPTRIGKSFGCAWIDYDNDGYPDLILGPKLYHNEQGKQFRDVTYDSGLQFNIECMGILVADYDCDGLLDIYMLYQAPPVVKGDREVPKQWVNETFTGMENQLWKNLGNGKFKNVTRSANAGGGKRHSHAASWFFYDDDHYPDLYIANDFGRNVLLRNKGDGTFEDISDKSQTAGYSTSMGVATGDLNNDGLSEIYVANMYSKMGRRIIGQVGAGDYPEGIYEQIKGSCAGNRLYTRRAGSEFEEIGEKIGVHDVGWAFGPTLLDMDGDGLLDIYATTGFMSFARGKPDG